MISNQLMTQLIVFQVQIELFFSINILTNEIELFFCVYSRLRKNSPELCYH